MSAVIGGNKIMRGKDSARDPVRVELITRCTTAAIEFGRALAEELAARREAAPRFSGEPSRSIEAALSAVLEELQTFARDAREGERELLDRTLRRVQRMELLWVFLETIAPHGDRSRSWNAHWNAAVELITASTAAGLALKASSPPRTEGTRFAHDALLLGYELTVLAETPADEVVEIMLRFGVAAAAQRHAQNERVAELTQAAQAAQGAQAAHAQIAGPINGARADTPSEPRHPSEQTSPTPDLVSDWLNALRYRDQKSSGQEALLGQYAQGAYFWCALVLGEDLRALNLSGFEFWTDHHQHPELWTPEGLPKEHANPILPIIGEAKNGGWHAIARGMLVDHAVASRIDVMRRAVRFLVSLGRESRVPREELAKHLNKAFGAAWREVEAQRTGGSRDDSQSNLMILFMTFFQATQQRESDQQVSEIRNMVARELNAVGLEVIRPARDQGFDFNLHESYGLAGASESRRTKIKAVITPGFKDAKDGRIVRKAQVTIQ